MHGRTDTCAPPPPHPPKGVFTIAANATLEAHKAYLAQPRALQENIRTVLYDQVGGTGGWADVIKTGGRTRTPVGGWRMRMAHGDYQDRRMGLGAGLSCPTSVSAGEAVEAGTGWWDYVHGAPGGGGG
jgi:hypothetical protein